MMTFRLHTQTIAASDGVRFTALVLHGALGSSQNFRSFAARLARLRPEYRLVLADLRNHGQSRGAPPPDTLEACANDVIELSAEYPDLTTVIGHSFGGKVAMEVARKMEPAGTLRQAWVLDSNPGSRGLDQDSEIRRVVSAVSTVPMPLARRADVVPRLKEQGLSDGLCSWMTTNLERRDDGYHWTFDLARVRALLIDYDARDFWPYLESRETSSTVELRVVVAEQSERLDAPIRERLRRLAGQRKLVYEVLPDAGHWLHVDNPAGLLTILAAGLPS